MSINTIYTTQLTSRNDNIFNDYLTYLCKRISKNFIYTPKKLEKNILFTFILNNIGIKLPA